MGKIKTVLFGMTGFGNSAAEALNNHDAIDLVAIFTSKRQEGPFPYYPCDHLYEMALKTEIPIYEGLNLRDSKTVEFIRTLSPGLAVVSTFSQIITKEIIQIPEHGIINLHPSLLPQYRGTTPTVWALINGEEETGISVHFIEDETIDSGKIILQSRLKIMPNDTDGTLRYRLAELSETTLSRAVDLILTSDRSAFPSQDESLATYCRKRTTKDAEINKDMPFKKILSLIMAMTPYPGAYLIHNNSKYLVKSAELISGNDTFQNLINGFIDLETSEGMVRFEIGEVVHR